MPPLRGGAVRRQLFAEVSDAEYALVRDLARREGVTLANYIRRCVNSVILEGGDDVPLLTEKEQGREKEDRCAG